VVGEARDEARELRGNGTPVGWNQKELTREVVAPNRPESRTLLSEFLRAEAG
jgi:hypothetical protein